MLPARLAVRQIPNSTREKTDCISSLATRADLDDQLLLSRPVSQPKSESVADSRDKWVVGSVALGFWCFFESMRTWRMHIGPGSGFTGHG